jgi:hypothetical protein
MSETLLDTLLSLLREYQTKGAPAIHLDEDTKRGGMVFPPPGGVPIEVLWAALVPYEDDEVSESDFDDVFEAALRDAELGGFIESIDDDESRPHELEFLRRDHQPVYIRRDDRNCASYWQMFWIGNYELAKETLWRRVQDDYSHWPTIPDGTDLSAWPAIRITTEIVRTGEVGPSMWGWQFLPGLYRITKDGVRRDEDRIRQAKAQEAERTLRIRLEWLSQEAYSLPGEYEQARENAKACRAAVVTRSPDRVPYRHAVGQVISFAELESCRQRVASLAAEAKDLLPQVVSELGPPRRADPWGGRQGLPETWEDAELDWPAPGRES